MVHCEKTRGLAQDVSSGEFMSLVTSSQKIIILGIIVFSITVFGIAVSWNIILRIQILSVSK